MPSKPSFVIRVDAEVYQLIRRHARPIEDTPNAVLRRLLKLDTQKHRAAVKKGGRSK
jgi:negative regulator of replication initiation